jgi:hypothetical protein
LLPIFASLPTHVPMSDLQATFNNLLNLLKETKDNSLAMQCYNDTEGEVAFHPKKSTCPTAQTFLDIYSNTDNSHIEGIDTFIAKLKEMVSETLCAWGMDTERGSYTLYTTANDSKLAGIIKIPRTLKEIRKLYFLQKEALEKIGETPLFDYEAHELTFVNRKYTG